jgi:phosphohistidine phosphatase SixA
MKHIYFVRHGEYSHDIKDLTADGIAQVQSTAELIAEDLKEKKIALLCSDKLRAKTSAQIIYDTLKQRDFDVANIVASEYLHEIKDPRTALRLIESQPQETYIIVSHQPDIPRLVRPLIFGHNIRAVSKDLDKGACQYLDLEAKTEKTFNQSQ